MRVPLTWLEEFVAVGIDVDDFVDLLDMTGTAVEAVERGASVPEGVVVGRVVTKEQHPDADKLTVATVDIGADEPLGIVCGAPNYEVGDKIAVALVGTRLPNGIKLKRAKIRGVPSEGMMCAPDELGMGSDHSGLLILDTDAPVGETLASYLGSGETVLELEITPNRPDCLSMVGVAREVGAITGGEATRPTVDVPESGSPAADAVTVTIGDPALCPRYTARIIRGVKVGPSPDWLAARVSASGARPINNVVDVTNYVMFELGQPLHSFDMDRLASQGGGTEIVVRLAREGEDLVTLDGQDRQLAPDTLLICDPSGPVALAGVMGGASTEVDDDTVTVLLESACFDTASVSRTSRRLGLFSEASQRFERGVDPNGCAEACDRAAALIAEVSGGEVAPGIVDAYPRRIEPLEVTLRLSRTNAVLGTVLDAGTVGGILERLGLDVRHDGADVLRVTVPTFRPDLEREIDLVEEVLRVHGMGKVGSTLPAGRQRIGALTLAQRRRAVAAESLRAAGLSEAITWSFGDPRDMDALMWTLPGGSAPVRLLNPMTEDQSVMRWTTLPNLLRAVAGNQRKGVADVHLYEIGPVWTVGAGAKEPVQTEVAAGVLAGRWAPGAWWEDTAAREATLDLFDGKGVLETLFEALGVEGWHLAPAERAWLQPGRSAEVVVDGEPVGWIGEVHPTVLERFEAGSPVTAFEIAMAPVLDRAREIREFVDLPRFPAVKADVALVVDEAVSAESVEEAIRSAGGTLLASVRLFDVYSGKGVPAGRKSLAFALEYRDPERTLTDDDVAATHERLVRKVTAAVGGELRT